MSVMEGVYLTALIISFIFFIAKFIEMRFITRENRSLKTIIIDSIVVYLSVIVGYFVIDQLKLGKKTLSEPQAFVDGPGF